MLVWKNEFDYVMISAQQKNDKKEYIFVLIHLQHIRVEFLFN